MDIRPITVEEFPEFITRYLKMMSFELPSPTMLERSTLDFDPRRSLAAIDRGAIVGTTLSRALELTLPGLRRIPAAGVTAVSVATTHRRRGILSELMVRQLRDLRANDEALAILVSSESSIYGRFGFGIASSFVSLGIDPREATFRPRAPGEGRARFVDLADAIALFPGIEDRWRKGQPGAIARSERYWADWHEERKPDELLAVHESASGEPDGYVAYKVTPDWRDGLPQGKLQIHDLAALTTDAYVALWQLCLGVDLVRRVEADSRPVDEPLRWLLENPRALCTTRTSDFFWARILDIPAALSARGYAADVELVLEVHDPMFADASGRYALSTRADGATCRRTDAPPDLRMEVAELGAIFLGGTVPTDLARAGRIVALRDGALRRADAAFTSSPRPWSSTWF